MIYVLPAMATDRKMYPGAWGALSDCTFAEWPTYDGEDSIAAIAKRVVFELHIQTGDILIGSSLGGIVGCEIAKLIPLAGLVLIGSAKSREEMTGVLALIQPVLHLAPLAFMQRMAGMIPNPVAQMFSKSEAEFIRAMLYAMHKWEGWDGVGVNLMRIHGNNDRVIPRPRGVQHVLDGGHFIAMTHAGTCVEIIKGQLEAVKSERHPPLSSGAFSEQAGQRFAQLLNGPLDSQCPMPRA